jgi:CspA family cold shock protein
MNESENLPQHEGYVKWFNVERGFGFLAYEKDDKECDVFCHFLGIKENPRILEAGEKVKFNIVEGLKGPKAIRIEKI